MRLIDANGSYTLNASDNTDCSLCFGGGIISCMDERGHCICEFDAEDAPTIQAVPVVHGRWGEYEPFRGWPCTACGEYDTDKGKKPSSRFCPNCGAKMDGDADG